MSGKQALFRFYQTVHVTSDSHI